MGDTHIMTKTNPFILLATPLLMLMAQVKQSVVHPDVDALHNQIVLEVKLFSSKLKQLKYPSMMVDSACYCLCAALDEAILASQWGTQSSWVQQSLLSLLCQETWGGERFYLIVEVLLQDLRKNLFVLEFIYVLLSLGFEGQYYGQQNILRDQVRNHIFQKITLIMHYGETELSNHVRDDALLKRGLWRRRRLTRFLAASAALLFAVTIYYNALAYQQEREAIALAKKVLK